MIKVCYMYVWQFHNKIHYFIKLINAHKN
jgi:hypothetical protein